MYKALSRQDSSLTGRELIWLQRAMLDGALMHRKSSEAGLRPAPPGWNVCRRCQSLSKCEMDRSGMSPYERAMEAD